MQLSPKDAKFESLIGKAFAEAPGFDAYLVGAFLELPEEHPLCREYRAIRERFDAGASEQDIVTALVGYRQSHKSEIMQIVRDAGSQHSPRSR